MYENNVYYFYFILFIYYFYLLFLNKNFGSKVDVNKIEPYIT